LAASEVLAQYKGLRKRFRGVSSCREHITVYVPPTILHKILLLDVCMLDPYATLME
ncbi:hypothetical protein STEG23_022452, partial [Scotinomys teguina]